VVNQDEGEAQPAGPAPGLSRDRATRVALTVVATTLVVFAAYAGIAYLTRRGDAPSVVTIAGGQAQGRVEDRPAPDFELPSVDGDATISLEGFRGRVVILNFWASWCGPCRTEAPHLQAIQDEFAADGVQVLGVDHDDDRAAARAHQEEFGLTFPSVYDPAGELAFDYELFGVPTTFLIDRDGTVVYRFTGAVDADELESALSDLLPGSR
jgi:cytochrome c biogenesis protein CcmG, thiol:disulfide interchange protein DsbE